MSYRHIQISMSKAELAITLFNSQTSPSVVFLIIISALLTQQEDLETRELFLQLHSSRAAMVDSLPSPDSYTSQNIINVLLFPLSPRHVCLLSRFNCL